MSLNNGTFRTFYKHNAKMKYIHTESNHLPNIIKSLLISIENRLSNLSSNKSYFKNQEHIIKIICGNLDITRTCHINLQTQTSKSVVNNEKIITFNASFNGSVSNEIGKSFFRFFRPKINCKQQKYESFKNTAKIKFSCNCQN